ncbi:hypothetical protein OPT61_g3632 [Boeremia exigua]|uniref:Uncharacterized protein n=1 Tax=Boeremia exigua TaxID=749465 RepID=A0ACC2IHA2_9PLEO|nr:hypothetical protein OPT61_g3632 [Boeremia exigua]
MHPGDSASVCTRASLWLASDEGDNVQPTSSKTRSDDDGGHGTATISTPFPGWGSLSFIPIPTGDDKSISMFPSWWLTGGFPPTPTGTESAAPALPSRPALPSGELIKGCVPNNCIAECIPWYALSLFLRKRPWCPCVPVTCIPEDDETDDEDDDEDDDDDDDSSDSDSGGKKKKCKLFGCGCGWEGLPFGPGCGKIDIDIDLPNLLPGGLFGPEPCRFFGDCPPNVGPDPEPCGPFGCNGYCNNERGCDPCPSEICGGPQCPISTGCGPKPGPNPTPNPKRPSKCEKHQETTVTEKLVFCTENISLDPTTIASINFTLSTTLTSTCVTPVMHTLTGCGILGTTTTTTVSSFTATSSEAPACSRAPLDINNDEGDNEQPPRTTDEPACTRAPLSLEDDEGDNERPVEGPSCTRAPLLLDDDEGDNAQPTSSDAPACTRAPLSLDDDEGNNEIPGDILSSMLSSAPTPTGNSTLWPNSTTFTSTPTLSSNSSNTLSGMLSFNSTMFTSTPTPTSNSSNTLSSMLSFNSTMFTSTPTLSSNSSHPILSTSESLMFTTANSTLSASRVLPPSTLSVSTTFPWGTGIPTGTPKPYCPTCDLIFSDCVRESCKPDGSDAEECAKFCLTALCYGAESADYCKRGPCRPAACPKEDPRNFFEGQPGEPFTTVLSLVSTTLTVTASPTYSTVSLSHSPTPTCNPGHTISPDSKWTALVEHQIQENPQNSTLSWTLWDEHGCKAGEGEGWNNQYDGHNISADIGAPERSQDYRMGYMLHTNVMKPWSTLNSEIEFLMSKPVEGCKELCWVKWKINNREESKSWQITDDCAQQCGSPKLTATDVTCDDGMNKWHDPGSSDLQKRGGYCTWHMPFQPANDDPPKPWTRESRWTVEIEQWMEYESSSIEWWLKDPNGNDAGHLWTDTSDVELFDSWLETQNRGPDLQMRYKMILSVLNPRKKDITQVMLTYQNEPKSQCDYYDYFSEGNKYCRPFYMTESDDETRPSRLNDCTIRGGSRIVCPSPMFKDNVEFSCDKVYDSFYPIGAGFQRRFKCWWPHDFVDPYGIEGVAVQQSAIDGVDGSMNGSWANLTWG